jgi:hypothetical protein
MSRLGRKATSHSEFDSGPQWCASYAQHGRGYASPTPPPANPHPSSHHHQCGVCGHGERPARPREAERGGSRRLERGRGGGRRARLAHAVGDNDVAYRSHLVSRRPSDVAG